MFHSQSRPRVRRHHTDSRLCCVPPGDSKLIPDLLRERYLGRAADAVTAHRSCTLDILVYLRANTPCLLRSAMHLNLASSFCCTRIP
ncbi:hypothetical protein HETIRDRAFT_474390 [Heterobasidion irregulare TC 32-1]|uniref:Uncharacterized protein n=1 Tax=Heterobasidion irregulare (strain TC 32-1) TaxID=747525 RepID=W4KD45_HETIT|nr:uncharacterized protein HETIRDRAFT_474390 [Heterobasidion irregulare TC 32-1]ETW83245.1 hypothetical protein HETIRDRAFT_474390 [Heterobasidion irregulare TC 32-1]